MFRFVQSPHLLSLEQKQIRSFSAPASRRQAAVYITVIAGQFNVRSLNVGFAIRVVMFIHYGNAKGSSNKTSHSPSFFLLFNSTSKIKMKRALRYCCSTVLRLSLLRSLYNVSYNGQSLRRPLYGFWTNYSIASTHSKTNMLYFLKIEQLFLLLRCSRAPI